MTAGAVLCKKRPYWGQDRSWEGNYLSYSRENPNSDIYNSSVNNLRNTDHFKSILFSAFVKKTNKFVPLLLETRKHDFAKKLIPALINIF